MAELIIDDEIMKRLREISKQENRPLDVVLRSILDSYSSARQPSDWPLMMAKMAEADTEIVWNEYASDLSERSRELLENDFADYLLKRLPDDDDNSA
jgi:hypothetical protein